MEMPPPRPRRRPWDPTAPSLLWAHEIRRENIHLTDQLDNTKATLASTVSTTNALNQSATELQAVVQELRTETRRLDDRLGDLERCGVGAGAGAAEKIEALARRVEVLRDENAALRERVEGEVGSTRRREEMMREEILAEARRMVRVEMEGFMGELAVLRGMYVSCVFANWDNSCLEIQRPRSGSRPRLNASGRPGPGLQM